MSDALSGSVNHVALAVSDLDLAMTFLGPVLAELGYVAEAPADYQGNRLVVNVNAANGTAINVWQATVDGAFEVWAPGLHHLALNAGSREAVDRVHDRVRALGGRILDGPGEFPFASGGYYAVYFLGPDDLKLEVVFMPELLNQP